MLSFHVIAQDSKTPWNQYCAQLQDGKVIVISDGIKLISDVTLDNGVKISADGAIIKIDGTKIVLQNGDCVDKEGKMTESKFN